MRHDQKPEVGTTVHLRPTTKTAPSECHAHMPGVVTSYEQWPYIEVELSRENRTWTIRVFHTNVGLHPVKKTSHGDQAEAIELKVPKPLHTPHKPVVLGPGEEEVPLW